ncbi:hypothetical protein AFR_28755 [Actinoplanes friuliensis DSM 7358]|uniref:Uncharacterized protein n=2 Tax=Actinoplanes friuliensis TaxID=196914 RepID=U5W4S6_9ACTN|nr:hypothetical protein AFR_28755 [Actinoplanes friuliensis DSM 7358]
MMTTERAPSDEPDGTPAYAASLHAPGDSVRPAHPPEPTDDDIAPDAAPAGDDPVGGSPGAGYDTEAVSGDTEIYRPD